MAGLGAGASLSTVTNVLKTLYPQTTLRDMLYKKNPVVGMMTKVDDFEGNFIQVDAQYGVGQGASANFANALANRSANSYAAFQLPRRLYYGIGSITGEAIAAGRSDKGSVIRTFKREQEGTMKTLSRQIANAVFGNGGGVLGQVAAIGPGTGISYNGQPAPTLTNNQIQLTDPSQVVWFEVDATHVTAATDGTTGAIVGGTPVHVTARNAANGVISYDTVVGAAGTTFASPFGVNYYIFRQGDFGNIAVGLGGWLPATDPTSSDSFLTVNRGVDPGRLAGLRFNGAGAPYEETLQNAMAYAGQEEASPDVGIMNPYDLGRLCVGINSRTTFTQTQQKMRMARNADGPSVIMVPRED